MCAQDSTRNKFRHDKMQIILSLTLIILIVATEY